MLRPASSFLKATDPLEKSHSKHFAVGEARSARTSDWMASAATSPSMLKIRTSWLSRVLCLIRPTRPPLARIQIPMFGIILQGLRPSGLQGYAATLQDVSRAARSLHANGLLQAAFGSNSLYPKAPRFLP
jgi:hypothetical protein